MMSRSQGRFHRFKIPIGIDNTFLLCRGARIPYPSHVRKLLRGLCHAGLYNPYVSLNTLPSLLTNTPMFPEWALEYVQYMCKADGKNMLKVMNLPCSKHKQIKTNQNHDQIPYNLLDDILPTWKFIGYRTKDWQRLKDDGTSNPPRKSTAK